MADTGFKFPTATGGISDTWTTPANAYADDANYATIVSDGSNHIQTYESFDFGVPSGVPIVGIEIVFKIKGTQDNKNIDCKIYKNSSLVYTDTIADVDIAEKEITVGGPTSLFSTSWDDTNFSNANYHIGIDPGAFTLGTISLNYVKVKVYYTAFSASTSPSNSPSNSPSTSPSMSESRSTSPSSSLSTSLSTSPSTSVSTSLSTSPSSSISTSPSPGANHTLKTKGNTTFVPNDILRIKDGIDDEWLRISGVVSSSEYYVERDLAGSYSANNNPTWKKGATIVNYRRSGDGGIYMTASESNAPYLSVFDHAGAPWTTINTRLRLGNLNGYLGYTDDLYGIAIGETNAYLTYDTSNGLRVKGNITATTGDIGGFSIGADYIRDAANSFGMASTVTAGSDVRFWAGDTFANRATAPFRIDEEGNVVANSLKRADFHWFTFFESIDGYSTDISEGGSITAFSQYVDIITAAGGSKYAEINKHSVLSPFSWDQPRSFKTVIKMISNSGQLITVGIGAGGVTSGAITTERQICFYINDATVYAYVADGSNGTTVEIDTFAALSTHTIEAILNPGVSCSFYIDGDLKTTITTNLPTGTSSASYPIRISVYAKGASERELWTSYWDFWQAI